MVYRNGCHVLPKAATRPHLCVYGDRSATRTVVLFGDSHAAQWFPAFNAAAKSEHVKLLYITKSACPAPSVSILLGSALFRACDVWRDKAIALINKRGHVNLIVFGGTTDVTLTKRHTAQVISTAKARAKEWRLGVRRTVLALRATAGRHRHHARHPAHASGCRFVPALLGRRQPPLPDRLLRRVGEPVLGLGAVGGEGVLGCRDRGLHLGLLHDDPVSAGHEHPCAALA